MLTASHSVSAKTRTHSSNTTVSPPRPANTGRRTANPPEPPVSGLASRMSWLVISENVKIGDAPPQEIVNNPAVVTAYLGKGGATAPDAHG